MSLAVLVLAAGESRRFPGDVPKQFVKFEWNGKNQQMWLHALYGLGIAERRTPSAGATTTRTPLYVYLAVRKDQLRLVEGSLTKTIPLEETRGQADSVRIALETIRHLHEDVLILNCDQGFDDGVLVDFLDKTKRKEYDGAITFQADPMEDSRWSYVDTHPWFTFGAEKKAIGTHAFAGAYYFSDTSKLYDALSDLCAIKKEEPYLSQVYGQMRQSFVSYEIPRTAWHDWGTLDAFRETTGNRESLTKNGWIGVDLDGTLAYHESGASTRSIGRPIPKMLDRVKKWLAQGKEVRILTARVSSMFVDAEDQRRMIQAWTQEHLGKELQVTCEKDGRMREFWDDRAVSVERNTGERSSLPSKKEFVKLRSDERIELISTLIGDYCHRCGNPTNPDHGCTCWKDT